MPTDHGQVTIIGSIHLSSTYFDHIRTTIHDREPDMVAVELDPNRVQSLFQDESATSLLDLLRSDYSLKARLLYAGLAYLQRQLAHHLGIDPEMNDMRVAVTAAAQQNCDVALIDRDIGRTLERVSDNISLLTLLRVWRRSRNLSEENHQRMAEVNKDLLADGLTDADVLTDYRSLLEQLIPEFVDAFIHERDQLMAQRLYALEQQGLDVVAVIGGAHEAGVRAELQRLREANVPRAQLPAVPQCVPRLSAE